MSLFRSSISTKASSTKSNTGGQYELAGSLAGHHGSVTCLKVTADGLLLASGGTDGTKLWDLRSMVPVLRPTGTGNRGATSCLLWLQREDHPGEILVYGTQTGWVVCWRQAADSQMFEEVTVFQMAEPAEITGLAFDSSTNRLAVSHRGCVIQVHELDDKLNPDPVFSVQVQNFLPKALAFIGEPKKRGELLAFGYHDGTILSLNAQTGEVKRAETGCLTMGYTNAN